MITSSKGAMHRVVVTGIGLRTGLGRDASSTWNGLRIGKSAARSLDSIGSGPGPTRGWFGFPLPGRSPGNPAPGWEEVSEAVADAGLFRAGEPQFDRDRAATVIGLSKGNLRLLTRLHRELSSMDDSSIGIAEADWTTSWPDSAARSAARMLDFRGPMLSPIAACATGVVAVLRASELIRSGACDLAVAGASDCSLEPIVLGAFDRMRALARVDGDPKEAVRPWDRNRSGFLVGEGGGILVLEREGHARARGALAYAEVVGGALGSDASHETNLDPDPTRLASLIGEALRRVDVGKDEVDYVNVHATATRVNDPLECRAIRLALGRYADGISCSANKAQIGHLLGGAGAAELAITCLAIRDQFIPPTLNLTDPDPSCDLDATPGIGRARPVRAALKLSLGFGGHMAVAALRQADSPRRPEPDPHDRGPGGRHPR